MLHTLLMLSSALEQRYLQCRLVLGSNRALLQYLQGEPCVGGLLQGQLAPLGTQKCCMQNTHTPTVAGAAAA